MRAEAAADLADLRDPDSGLRPDFFTRMRRGASEPLNAAADALLYGPRRNAANATLGDILSMQGDNRDAFVRELAQALEKGRRKRAPAISEALVKALLGTGGVVASQGVAR